MADQEEKVEQQEETAAESAEAQTAAEEKVEEAGEAIAETAAEVGEEAAEAESAAEVQPADEPAPEQVEPADADPEPAPGEPVADGEPAAAEGEPEEYSWEVLHKKTVSDLRDIAQGIEHEALQGYSTMHKEQLVPALCTALGIEAHAHHEVVGINKDRVKNKIRALKVERQAALEAGDHAQLKLVRRRIKSLKRKIRRATV